jgi:uncharacterized protein
MTTNSKNILYAKFQTKDNHYIYDTYSNEILQVAKCTWDIIDDYLENPENKIEIFDKHIKKNNYTREEILEAIKDIEEGRDNGYLQPCNIKKMQFYDSHKQMIEDIKYKIKSLGLEVTQNCNFRCKYCVYGECYSSRRNHKNRNMDWPTALNAIKIFMQHSSKAERKNIGFWGGEPLLKFDLIKKVVNYVKKQYPDEDIHYSFTTNGSLFNDENIEFLIKNNFHILVSLDGPKHINDKYRADIKGNGTFDRVMHGLQKIIAKGKKYYNEYISFNCILTPNTDFSDVLSFFSENRLFENNKDNINISAVDSYQTSFFDKYGDYSQEQKIYLNKIYYESAINNLLDKEMIIRKLNEQSMLKIFNRCRHKIGNMVALNGCCVPLLKKMHVDVYGNIHTCEKVPLYNALGNVNTTGIDYDSIVKFVEEYSKNSIKDCKHCWAVRMCPACYKYFIKNNKWQNAERQKTCINIRDTFLIDLILYSSIIEDNPKAFDYMKEIKISV